jgi:hypothetical protein
VSCHLNDTPQQIDERKLSQHPESFAGTPEPTFAAAVLRAIWAAPQLASIPGRQLSAEVSRRTGGLAVVITVPVTFPQFLEHVVTSRAQQAIAAQGINGPVDITLRRVGDEA